MTSKHSSPISKPVTGNNHDPDCIVQPIHLAGGTAVVQQRPLSGRDQQTMEKFRTQRRPKLRGDPATHLHPHERDHRQSVRYQHQIQPSERQILH